MNIFGITISKKFTTLPFHCVSTSKTDSSKRTKY